MKTSMQNKLDQLTQRLAELNLLLSREDVTADMNQYRKLNREHAELAPLVEQYGLWRQALTDEATALELLNDDSDIGAILLECSDLPPYAAAVQAATQLPVFDFITLIRWLHHATTQRPYSGWI